MFFTMSVAPPPKKILRVQFVILAVMGWVGASNRIASLSPATSVCRSAYLNTDPSKLTTGVRVAPLFETMRGRRVVPAAIFVSDELRTFRFPVISIITPSSASDTNSQLFRVRVQFSVAFAKIRFAFVSSVARSTHSDSVTFIFIAVSSGAIVRAEKTVSVVKLQFVTSTFASYTNPLTVKAWSVRFKNPIAAEDA
jgi:hypothetical protein